MKVGDIAASQPPKILIYSGPGTGKTALLLTLGESLQVIDMDAGLRTALSIKDAFSEDRVKPDVRQFIEKEPHKMALAFKQCKECVIGIANDCNAKRYPFEVLGIDSFSSMAEAALNYTMYNAGKLGHQPEIQHWGLAISEVKQILLIIRSLPIPVVILGHESFYSVGSGLSKEDKIQLGVYGKNLPFQTPQFFDEYWRMRIRPIGQKKFQYLVQTFATDIADAKSRGGLTDGVDSSCGMWKLLEMIGYKRKGEKNVPVANDKTPKPEPSTSTPSKGNTVK